MPAELQASRQDGSLILTISNPGAGNLLHPDIYAAAIETLSTAERDPSVRAVILTGAGNTFCSGAFASDGTGKSQAEHGLNALHGWIEAILDCPKPVICAVEGAATGAGFALALASDFIVAADSATFSMPSVKAALTPDAGSWFLNQALPRQAVAEILIGGQAMPASRLHQLGVINRLTEDGEALNAALALADAISALPADTLESLKGMLREAGARTFGQFMEIEKQHFLAGLHRRTTQEKI